MGVAASFILRERGLVLVDAGAPGMTERLVKQLRKLEIKPRDIGLIVITHGHMDHIGSAADIKKLTGAPLAMHQEDRACLEQGRIKLPPGVNAWGRVLIKMMRLVGTGTTAAPAEVDVVLGAEDFSLEPYGLSGRVIHTPGHSPGSVSLVLDDGRVIAGDAAMNGLPLRLGAGLPVFAENMGRLRESWRRLLALNPTTIYPSHGRPFPASVMAKALA